MAFCNSCGASLESGAKFCTKCGAVQPVSGTVPVAGTSARPPVPTLSPSPSQGSNSALKIILIVVGVFVVVGILAMATIGFIGWRIARHSRVQNRDGNVRVESPFGTVESSHDGDTALRNLGVEAYPGAHVIKGTTANMGGTHTVAAEFESDDSPDKVAAFYHSRLPNANFNASDGDHYSIISTANNNMITINVERQGDGSRVQITSIKGKGESGDND